MKVVVIVSVTSSVMYEVTIDVLSTVTGVAVVMYSVTGVAVVKVVTSVMVVGTVVVYVETTVVPLSVKVVVRTSVMYEV